MAENARDERYEEAIREAFEENGGTLHRDEGVATLQRRFDLSEEKAREVLLQYVQFNEEGVAVLKDRSMSARGDTAPESESDEPTAGDYRSVLDAAFDRNNGRLHRDEGIALLEEEFGLSKDEARTELHRHVEEFGDQGWAESFIHKTFTGDVGTLDQNPGRELEEEWRGLLPVLEDVDHPLVPDQEEYLERPIEGKTTDAEVLAKAMADPDFSPLLVGDAGTGKDTLVQYVCAQTNRPCVRVNFGEAVRYGDLVGTRIPETSEDDDGVEVVWEDGMLTRAVKYGYVFIADEINAAPPAATMPLHQVTEEGDAAELVIREESKVITPHPQFRFVATMNPPRGGYGGVERLNDAFKSRFYTIEIDYLEPEQEASLIEERFRDGPVDVSNSDIEDLTQLAAGLRKQYQRGDIVTPVTTRELIKVCKMSDIMSVKQAARMVIGGHAKENDRRLIIDRINSELSS